MALLQAYKITKEKFFLDASNIISNSTEIFQNKDGSLSLHKNSDIIHMHSLCYALEGLLYYYFHTKEKHFLEIADNAIKWCLSQILDDGGTFLWFNSSFPQAKTSYHVAQLMRIILILQSTHSESNYESSLRKLNSFLVSLQATHTDKRINGGFYEEYYKTLFGWKKRKRINSWGSIFALQSLIWYENRNSLTTNELEFLY